MKNIYPLPEVERGETCDPVQGQDGPSAEAVRETIFDIKFSKG